MSGVIVTVTVVDVAVARAYIIEPVAALEVIDHTVRESEAKMVLVSIVIGKGILRTGDVCATISTQFGAQSELTRERYER